MSNLNNSISIRIKKSFLQSQKIFNDSQRSIHWKKIFLKKSFNNISYLKNFRNNGLSYGFDDSGYYSKKKFDKEINILISEVKEEYILDNIKKKNIGNLKKFFTYKNIKIDPGDLHLIKFFFDLEKQIFSKYKIKYICEIGGGYGGLAEKIISKHNCKYILIDLPESNFISSYYLTNNFPKKKFLFYSDIADGFLSEEILKEYDIFIMPPEIIFKDLKINLFLNTRSMMEMTMETISKYFKIIQSNISNRGFFFNVNRYIKFRAGQPIFLKDYPYDNNWEVLSSTKSFQQDWIHQLITRRNYNLQYNKISIELQNIMHETKKYLQPDEYRYLNSNYFRENNYFKRLIKKILYIFFYFLFKERYYIFKQKFYGLINKL